MGNFGIISGPTTNARLTTGTTQLTLTSIAGGSGVAIAGNQFTVDGIGNYCADVTFYPSAITQGHDVTVQIWNATTAALAGSAPLTVPINTVGNISQRVKINFAVANTAHNFQIRLVVPNGINAPNATTLTARGGAQFLAAISSVSSDAAGSGTYGDGNDGAVTIAAPTTLARDMYYQSLTINAGIAVDANGFRIFVRDTLTMAAGSTITNNGGAGASSAAGGAAGAAANANTLGPGFIGGVAAPGFGAGNAGTNATTSVGGTGGAGGAGNAGGNAGGAGGTVTNPTAAQGGTNVMRAMPHAVIGNLAGTAVATLLSGGAGGGSGGGSGAVVSGGGGGGAGVIMVAARIFAGTGALNAIGGAGGDGGAVADAGGGGGGGGGVIITVSDGPLPATITTSVVGGAGGAGGAGGGVAGGAGGAGTAVHVQLGV